jgi:hypothetical protein
VRLDLKQGRNPHAGVLAKNPNGRIPLLEVPGHGYLSESHAIIRYLAEGSRLLPTDDFDRADVADVSSSTTEPNIGTARFWIASLHKTEAELGEKLVEKRKNGRAALAVLEQRLKGQEFLSAGGIRSPTSRCTRTSRESGLLEGCPRSASGVRASPRSPGTCRLLRPEAFAARNSCMS